MAFITYSCLIFQTYPTYTVYVEYIFLKVIKEMTESVSVILYHNL